jgi:hypothetical protein
MRYTRVQGNMDNCVIIVQCDQLSMRHIVITEGVSYIFKQPYFLQGNCANFDVRIVMGFKIMYIYIYVYIIQCLNNTCRFSTFLSSEMYLLCFLSRLSPFTFFVFLPLFVYFRVSCAHSSKSYGFVKGGDYVCCLSDY